MIAVAQHFIFCTILASDDHKALIIAKVHNVDIIFACGCRPHDMSHRRLKRLPDGMTPSRLRHTGLAGGGKLRRNHEGLICTDVIGLYDADGEEQGQQEGEYLFPCI